MEIQSLQEKFKSAFGISRGRVKTHNCPPIRVRDDEFVFTLRKAESKSDITWLYLNADLVEATQRIANDLANEALASTAQVALSVCAINGVPIFKVVGIEVKDEEMNSIQDINNPPDRIKYGAATLFMSEFLNKMEDFNVINFLAREYESAFSGKIKLPSNTVEDPDPLFICEACHFSLTLTKDQESRLKEVIEEKGGIDCLSCGEIAKKVEKEDKEDPLSSPPGNEP